MGRPCIDPVLKAERQKACRKKWREANRDEVNKSNQRRHKERYHNEPEFKALCIKRSILRHAYKAEIARMATIEIA